MPAEQIHNHAAELFDPIESQQARAYGDELLRLGEQEAVARAEAWCSGAVRNPADIEAGKLSALVMAAQTAGILHGTESQGSALEAVKATGRLDEESAGYFGSMVARANSDILTDEYRVDRAAHLMGGLRGYRAQRPELAAADDFELAATAYVAGLAHPDKETAVYAQDVLDKMIESRTQPEA